MKLLVRSEDQDRAVTRLHELFHFSTDWAAEIRFVHGDFVWDSELIKNPLELFEGPLVLAMHNEHSLAKFLVDRYGFAFLCDGQVKTDTELSHLGQPLEVMGTDIPQIRVQPLAVVEHFDVIDHIIPRFLPRGIVPPCGTLPLDTPKEPLGHGVV